MSTQGRDMRGASYMDQYDSNYGDDDYGTSKSDQDDLGCCAKYVCYHLFVEIKAKQYIINNQSEYI